MINILPHDIKNQIKYSRYNLVLLHYIIGTAIIGALLGLTIVGSYWYSQKQINELRQDLEQIQQENKIYEQTQSKATALQSRLNLTEQLFNNKTEFSKLLKDVAAVLPPKTYINGINLTGDETTPLKLLISIQNFNDAAIVRNAVATSPRFKDVDIQGISAGPTGGYAVDLVMALQ